MHSMILWTALTASAGLPGGPRVAVSACITGNCPNTVAAAPATVAAPAPVVYQAAAAPTLTYAAPAAYSAAPMASAAPVRARRLAFGRRSYTSSSAPCPNGTCPAR